jgi:flavin reductase (DIM6/NTAB) family NADH-FMN oxidoreductase RutF
MFTIHTSLKESGHAQPRVTAVLSCGSNLMALSWHMPISKEPFRYAIAMREENYTHTLLENRSTFALNFLHFDTVEAIDLTGRHHGDAVDKLELSGLKTSECDAMGNLLLDDADFIYSCRIIDSYKNGDHTIFIAEVPEIRVNDTQSQRPTLFLGKGRYATMTPPVQLEKTEGEKK